MLKERSALAGSRTTPPLVKLRPQPAHFAAIEHG
jgi:hypothetical protein